jgi:hypothetical protein
MELQFPLSDIFYSLRSGKNIERNILPKKSWRFYFNQPALHPTEPSWNARRRTTKADHFRRSSPNPNNRASGAPHEPHRRAGLARRRVRASPCGAPSSSPSCVARVVVGLHDATATHLHALGDVSFLDLPPVAAQLLAVTWQTGAWPAMGIHPVSSMVSLRSRVHLN